MKKWFFALLAPLSLLGSCKIENTPIDYLPLVVGQWAVTQSNGVTLPTDSIYFYTLNPTLTASYATREVVSDSRAIWKETNLLNYTVTDNHISIVSSPGATTTTSIKMTIEYITPAAMVCQVTEYMVEGKKYNVPFLITLEKCYNNLVNQIIGIWTSNVVTDGTLYEQYWNFKIGGRYDFYIYDPATNSYRMKSLDKSSFKVYGRYLVCIYSTDTAIEPADGQVDIWRVLLSSDASMVWTSLNSAGSIKAYYNLGRVGQLP